MPAVVPCYAATLTVLTLYPDRLTTGLAPLRSADRYDTVSVCDSPGKSVMSLSLHSADITWLSPEAGTAPEPRRTSPRRKNATVVLAVLVTVTVVSLSAPLGPDWL